MTVTLFDLADALDLVEEGLETVRIVRSRIRGTGFCVFCNGIGDYNPNGFPHPAMCIIRRVETKLAELGILVPDADE